MSNFRTRINGAMLGDYQGKTVCLLGEVLEVDPRGTSFKVRACDGRSVVVQTTNPVQGALQGMVEVVGSVTPRNTITCSSYDIISEELSKDFDAKLYNTAVQMAADCESKYIGSNM